MNKRFRKQDGSSRAARGSRRARPACSARPCTSRASCTAKKTWSSRARLEGSIEHTRSLSIGKEGGVKGNIRAKFVIIEGRVEGDIYATESVSIRQTAKVIGNIFAPRVGIADGAHFSGRIDMNHKGVAAKRRQAALRSAERSAGRAPAGVGRLIRAASVSTILADSARRDSCAPSAALLVSSTTATFASGYSSHRLANPKVAPEKCSRRPRGVLRGNPEQRHALLLVGRQPGRLMRELDRSVPFDHLPGCIPQQVIGAVTQRSPRVGHRGREARQFLVVLGVSLRQ